VSRLPIRIRLTLVFAGVMAVVLAALGAFLYVRLGDSLDDRISDDLNARSAALHEWCDRVPPTSIHPSSKVRTASRRLWGPACIAPWRS
jgi:hypothetical protein